MENATALILGSRYRELRRQIDGKIQDIQDAERVVANLKAEKQELSHFHAAIERDLIAAGKAAYLEGAPGRG